MNWKVREVGHTGRECRLLFPQPIISHLDGGTLAGPQRRPYRRHSGAVSCRLWDGENGTSHVIRVDLPESFGGDRRSNHFNIMHNFQRIGIRRYIYTLSHTPTFALRLVFEVPLQRALLVVRLQSVIIAFTEFVWVSEGDEDS